MAGELCRDVAFEAWHRGARVNPHELWATLETVDDLGPRLVVDLWSEPAVWWAWWSLGVKLIGVAACPTNPNRGFAGRLPESVTELVGDPVDPVTRLRVADQVAGRPVDVVVLGLPGTQQRAQHTYEAYAPLVRDGGLVLVHGIANRQFPGVAEFWSRLDAGTRKDMIGSDEPDGYGIVEIHRKDREQHG